jgi:polyhydroxyalkanoate synthase
MSSVFDPSRSLEQRRQAVANLFDFLVRGGVADTRRTPSEVIDDGPKRTLHRYDAVGPESGPPVLLVPPLGAQATCMDLRRGCSLAEHLVTQGRRTYLVDYGRMGYGDRDLGIEFWLDEVLPPAIERVSEDAGGAPVQLVGWCMGGLFALGTVALRPELPVSAVAMVASPFDVGRHPLTAPIRAIGGVTGGHLVGTAFRVLGGVPARLVGPAFKATAIQAYVKKPLTLWSRRDDREFLAQIEAVDGLMNDMLAYPGKATMQVYRTLVIKNELASGRIEGPTRTIDLADVTAPVMNIAGTSDVLVPVAAAQHVGDLLPNAAEVRLETAPGGHLGVLTGGKAATTTWPMIDDFLAAHA